MSQAARTPDAPRVAPEDPTIPIPDRQLAGSAAASPSPPAPTPDPSPFAPSPAPSDLSGDPPRDPPPPTLRTTDLRPRILAGLFAIAVIAIAAGRLTDDEPPATVPSDSAAARDPAAAARDPLSPDSPGPGPAASSEDAPPGRADGDTDGPALPGTETAAAGSATTSPAATTQAPSTPAPAAPPTGRGTTSTATPAPSRASLARRECMAQVEGGRLFIEQARKATDRGDYEIQVTREIERLAAARAITEYRLTLVSIRMWGLRDGDTPAAQWWTDQYRRCEATRLRGGEYVVGS